MTKPIPSILTRRATLTRRELARQALAGTAGLLLASALPASSAQPPLVVDPNPAVPPPLPNSLPNSSSNSSPKPMPMSDTPLTEGELLTQLVPVAAGYALSETQAKETALQLKDYPGGFAKARAYLLPDAVGPAFAADAPARKERTR